jgi:hypothetical protein
MSLCKTCGTEIDWATTASTGAMMPVDHDSAGRESGTLAVWRAEGKLQCRVLRKDEKPEGIEKRGTAHWSTCPQAGEHKRK